MKSQKQSRKTKRGKKPGGKVGTRACELLLDRKSPAMTFGEMAAKLRKELKTDTQVASLNWYATKLRAAGFAPRYKKPAKAA